MQVRDYWPMPLVTHTDRAIRVMIVDAHRGLREMLAAALAVEPDILVVALCCNGEEALPLAEGSAPEVVVMDLTMPVMDGLRATEALLRCQPRLRIWIHTATPHSPLAEQAVAAGARGVVAKSGDLSTLLDVIRTP